MPLFVINAMELDGIRMIYSIKYILNFPLCNKIKQKIIIFFIVVHKKVLVCLSYYNILIRKFHMKLEIIMRKLENKEEINLKNLLKK